MHFSRLVLGLLAALALSACSGGTNFVAPSNSGLTSIAVSTGTITPSFSPDLDHFWAEVPSSTESVRVTPTTDDLTAIITVDDLPVASGSPSEPLPLAEGANHILIKLMSPDGRAIGTWTLTVVRGPLPRLTGLSLSAGELNPAFDPEITAYGASAGYLSTSVRVTARTRFDDSVITIDGVEVASGLTSAALPLSEGLNEIPIRITTREGESRDYLIRVFREGSSSFAERTYFKASNSDPHDWFGCSVALSHDTLVVGALGERSRASGVGADQSDNSGIAAGAVYVFVRLGEFWTQQAYIKPSSNPDYSRFGSQVALRGDTLAVSALDDGTSGAVYVFTRSDGIWSQQARIQPDHVGSLLDFGSALSLGLDTLAVGTHAEHSNATGIDGDPTNDLASDSGAAWVFTRDGDIWSQQAYIKASDSHAGGRFGTSVSLSDNGALLAVGAPVHGAAYVFVRGGTTWSEQAKVSASNGESGDHFGTSVAISNRWLAVGADQEDSAAMGINGDQTNNGAFYSGAVYLFTRNGNSWPQHSYLKASNPGTGDHFGARIALNTSGDRLLVSAFDEDGSRDDPFGYQIPGSGATYLFVRDGDRWMPPAYIKPSNADPHDGFGYSIAIHGDEIAVGTTREDSNAKGIDGDRLNNDASDSGAVYLFR